jgi:uncharacterized NAD(P)/FAD-binding protein YdhS
MTILRTSSRRQPLQVVVVGGGAAAVIAVLHLFRRATPTAPIDVHLVERSPTIGPGLAYRTDHARHTVNNFAERLSAVDGDPGHLIRWCAARGMDLGARSFPTRKIYGQYLSSVLEAVTVPDGSSLRRACDEVVDVLRTDQGWQAVLASGTVLAADKVVLALGNPPPHAQPHLEEALGERFVVDPWTARSSPGWRPALSGVRRVLLLGTGLTMLDMAIELEHLLPRAEMVAASRRGRLPAAHVVEPTDGTDWRDAVDGVRGFANQLWGGLAAEDQARFASTYAHEWDLHRHRMSPAMSHHLARLRDEGTLVVRTVSEVAPEEFDLVLNCTGPRPVPTRGWNVLVDALLERGLVRSHRLGLGVDLVAPGHPVSQDDEVLSDLFWLGAARKGLEWEVGAIPDLRGQAVALADVVSAAAEEAADERAGVLR